MLRFCRRWTGCLATSVLHVTATRAGLGFLVRFLVKMPLYLVDVHRDLSQNYKKMLGKYYAVIDTYARRDESFNRSVEDYTKD